MRCDKFGPTSHTRSYSIRFIILSVYKILLTPIKIIIFDKNSSGRNSIFKDEQMRCYRFKSTSLYLLMFLHSYQLN